MHYIDRLFIPNRRFSFSIEGQCIDDAAGLTGTHQKSFNWDDVEDGVWQRLGLPETIDARE